MTLRVHGLENVKALLRSVSATVGAKALEGAVRVAFKRVAESAKALAPRDTGALADAIRIRVVRPKDGDAVVAAGIVVVANTVRSRQARMAAAAFGEAQSKRLPPSRRWHFPELGTSHSPATPFIRPALDAHAQEVVDSLGQQINKRIQAAAKKKGGGK